jgi:plastocyanin
MLEDLWNGFLELTAQFVIPDWGALVALLPVFIFVLTIVWLVMTFLRLLRAPKAQRGKGRVIPRNPTGVHLPGPSFAPIFASIGVFLLFLGVVFPGPILLLGAIALVLTLIYWLTESVRIFEHDLGVRSAPELPAVVHEGPPPGVHLPGPTFRPVLGAIGTGMLMLGLVFGGWLLAAGVLALVATLVGWLVDAGREYANAEQADMSGHLQSLPAPRWPSFLFVALAVLLIGGVVLQAGWLPPRDVNGGAGATASGAPGGSGAPPGAPAGSGPPGEPGGSGGPPGAPQADAVVHAKDIAFVETTLTAPAGRPFTLAFVNEDPGTPHNVELKDSSGTSVFKGAIFAGPDTKVYDVLSLPAGSYTFACSVHPNMTGSATLQ